MANDDEKKNMLVFVATYDSLDAADEDYRALLDMHKEGLVGTYDVGVVTKSKDGRIDIARHNDATGRDSRGGLAIGAVLGLIFPPSLIATAIVGAGAGSLIGHSFNKISRHDLRDLGHMIEDNQVALVVLGEVTIEDYVRKAARHAIKEYKQQFNADVADYNRQLEKALKAA